MTAALPAGDALASGADDPGLILVVNAGSSSLKFAAFSASAPPRRLLAGQVERVGHPEATLAVRFAAGDSARSTQSVPVEACDQPAAARVVLGWLQAQGLPRVVAVGHRLVFGGAYSAAPAWVSRELLAELQRLAPLFPEHLPAELALLTTCMQVFPALPQLACFDTAFHSTLPRVARMLPLPRRLEASGVRRYGYHGLSYTFLLAELARVAGEQAARGRLILAHLGNGASLAAVRDGACVDTSMGYTPASGLVMATRSGELDPGIFHYLAQAERMTSAEFHHMINHESGLRGIAETSSDMRDLLCREASDPRAAEAIELFCYQAKKWIGSYAAVLGGLDTLVFSGGIGEHAAPVRARICAGLEFLGITLDAERNARGAPLISTGRVAVRVMATDEEIVIARAVLAALLARGPAPTYPA